MQCRAKLGIEWNRPEAGNSQVWSFGRGEKRLYRVVSAVVAAHVLDVTEHAIGPALSRVEGSLRQSRHRPRDDASGHLGRDRHEEERRPRPQKLGVLDGPLGSRRQIEHQQIERAPLERRRESRRGGQTPSWRATYGTRRAPRSQLERLRLRDRRAIEKTPIPFLVCGSATFWRPPAAHLSAGALAKVEAFGRRRGNEHRTLDTGHARL